MKRLLGLDYGASRIGVALSDPGRAIASPHSAIHHSGWGPSARAVKRLLLETDSEYVVLGLPLDMSGTAGSQAQETLGFARVLRGQGVRVALQDERLTTFEAEEALKNAGKTREERRDLVDQVAAALILQAWLDAPGSEPELEEQEPQGGEPPIK